MHIILMSPQPNLTSNHTYLNTHIGQESYHAFVEELAIEMALLGHTVDLVTRKIDDSIYQDYPAPMAHSKLSNNLRIIQIPTQSTAFVADEAVWEILYEWVKNVAEYYYPTVESLDFISGHGPIGGLASALLSEKTNVPYAFTPHSFAKAQLDKIEFSSINMTVIDGLADTAKQLMAERAAMKGASVLFASTQKEVNNAYLSHTYKDIITAKKDRLNIVLPGIRPFDAESDTLSRSSEAFHQAIDERLVRDITHSRLDLPYMIIPLHFEPYTHQLKLLHTYAQSEALRAMTNIVFINQGCPDIKAMYEKLPMSEKKQVQAIQDVIAANDLDGQVTFMNAQTDPQLTQFLKYMSALNGFLVLMESPLSFSSMILKSMHAGLPIAVNEQLNTTSILEENGKLCGIQFTPAKSDQITKSLMYILKNYDHCKTQALNKASDTFSCAYTAQEYIKALEWALKNPIDREFDIPDYFKSPSDFLDFKLDPLQQFYLTDY